MFILEEKEIFLAMMRVTCIFLLLFATTLFGKEPLPQPVVEHIDQVKQDFKLSFLGKGTAPFGDGVFDLEFVIWDVTNQEEGRVLIKKAVEDLKSRLKDVPLENIRYGISFLDKGGDLQKEGIARIWAVKPRSGKEVKIFYSIFEQGELKTLAVEDFSNQPTETNLQNSP